MAIYKPTNCYPFSGSIDPTQAFRTIEKKKDGSWGVKDASPVYLTGKIETDNHVVAGYKVRLYMDNKLIFEGKKISPMSELPKFAEDPTVNSGVNGTSFAIPLFQSGNPYKTLSFNSIYFGGDEAYDEFLDNECAPVSGDFIISDSDGWTGSESVGYWTRTGDIWTCSPTWDGKLNGYSVSEDDVICINARVSGSSRIFLCHRTGVNELTAVDSILVSEDNSALCVRKGNRAGLYYVWGDDEDVASLNGWRLENWYKVCGFAGIDDSDPNNPEVVIARFDSSVNLLSGNLSWTVVFYQRLSNEEIPVYSMPYVADNNLVFKYSEIDDFPTYLYDMSVASGTILGSCAKRLHLSDAVDQTHLPGFGMESPIVLQGYYGELFATYYANVRMVPSCLIDSYDASYGLVYPNNRYMTQEGFDAFTNQSWTSSNKLAVRFYKYSSNSADLLSNEKVAASYINVGDTSLDPRAVLMPGYVCDGVTLQSGDRVLWCNSFGTTSALKGAFNGLWVVSAEGEPSRPADGNDYADYIGKAILVSGGSRNGLVYISDAKAGSSVELGQIPLYFYKQKPIALFNWQSSYFPSSSLMSPSEVDYFFPDEDFLVNDFYFYKAPSSADNYSIPFPVTRTPSGEISIIACLADKSGYTTDYKYYLLYLNNQGFVQTSLSSQTGYFAMKFGSNVDFQVIYLKGKIISDSSKYFRERQYGHWYYTQSVFATRLDVARFIDINSTALVLSNTTTRTYISPSTMISSGMLLGLKDGARYNFNSQPSSSYDHTKLKIDSYDSVFSCITHWPLTAPFKAAEGPGNPKTPYKYDALSCYRVSDQNGFSGTLLLTPDINPDAYNGPVFTGYSAPLEVICFHPDGEVWNTARIDMPISDSVVQSTDWFSDGMLDAEFMGLEPGDSYKAYAYVKDPHGRIFLATKTFSVPDDADDHVEKFSLMANPTTTGIIGGGSTFSFVFSKEALGAEAAGDMTNMKGYYSRAGTIVSMSFSYSATDTFALWISISSMSYDNAGDNIVLVEFDAPNGHFAASANFTGTASSPTLKSSYVTDHVVFTGTFPGTLTAEPDCSTQSVVLTYTPGYGEEDLAEALPPEQNGSYDVYRREYADVKKTYDCAGTLPAGGQQALWYGEWEPAIIGAASTVMRDFNVKQGHSYQYAIVPRVGSSLKIERTGRRHDGTQNDTRVVVSDGLVERIEMFFDNSMLGISDNLSTLNTDRPKPILTSYSVTQGDDDSPVAFGDPMIDIDYKGADAEGRPNAYVDFFDDSPQIGATYPIKFSVVINYLGIDYSAKVVFSSATEFTVEPVGLDYGWRRRVFANGGDPVYVQWDAWSLTELSEVDPASLFQDPLVRRPFVGKAYEADLDRIWLFRYDAEPGSQSINLTKGEISTLGRYARFSSGALNAESGEVSAWLGSEVVPGSRLGYVERRRSTIWAPASSNEAAAMLAAFREMVASDKPKLLRDRKGRSWIVQVSGGGSTTADNIIGTPTKVSFSWKEIASTGPYVAIFGDGEELPELDKDGLWEPNIILAP